MVSMPTAPTQSSHAAPPVVDTALNATLNANLDVESIRKDFPMLQQHVHGKPLIYLDNGSTSQKPQAMIDRLSDFYSREYTHPNENHALSKAVTQAYEATRETVAHFLNARDTREIVFLRGCTECINSVALAFERSMLQPGDEVLLTTLEHVSNILPWQVACQNTGAKITVAPITPSGDLDMEQYAAKLSERVKLVAVSHVSNALGSVLPIKEIVRLAHARGIPVLVDGAQGVPHLPVDVQELDCDFYIGSGHKMGGPTGAGFYYAKAGWLEKLEPQEVGGSMVTDVQFGQPPQYAPVPRKFEAGTPAFAEVIGMGAAIAYWQRIGMQNIAAYERELLAYTVERLASVPNVRLVGTPRDRVCAIAFEVQGMEPKQVEERLDQEVGISARGGMLDAEPLMHFLGVPGVVRASFLFYNTRQEADALVSAVASIAA